MRLPRSTVRALLACSFVVANPGTITAQQPGERYDLLIAGGSVIDGTGAPARVLDVAIRGDRIVAMAPSLPRERAARVIDATSRTVTPGFIDLHAHLEPLLDIPLAESALRQGVTLAVGGQDGSSPLPLAAHLDSVRAKMVGINVAWLVGHNDVRRAVLGLAARAPGEHELARMKALVASAMADGAFGFSTGVPDIADTCADIEEVIALAAVAGESGGFYSAHLRDECGGPIDGVAQALEIARRARVPLLLTQHQLAGEAAWGQSSSTLAMVDSARRAGSDVMLDVSPYTAIQTGITGLVPAWAMTGGTAGLRELLENPLLADSIQRGMVDNILAERGGRDLARVQFTQVSWDTSLQGKTLTELAECRNLEPIAENGASVVLEAVLSGGGNAVYHALDEQDVRRIMMHPATTIASGGRLSQPGGSQPHPRAYGTFPRVLGEYVRDQQVLPMESAIHKMTQLPAKRLGITDRGVLAVGAFADVVVFDAATVRDQATIAQPHQYPVGIETVVVNGVVAVEGGAATGVRSGRVLRNARGPFAAREAAAEARPARR